MGACVSSPEGCVRARSHPDGKKSRRPNRVVGRRVWSRPSESRSLERVQKSASTDRRFNNLIYQGSNNEDAWYDSSMILESDGDEDFHSVQEDNLSLNGLDGASMSSFSSHRDADQGDRHSRGSHALSIYQGEVAEGAEAKQPVYADDISPTVDENNNREEVTFDNCGLIPNNCLPCIPSSTVVPTTDKRRPLSFSPPNTRRKASLKLSFKWKDGHANGFLLSSKALIMRPRAGLQVPFCPAGKITFDSWSIVEPNTFKVRGENYFRDRKKEFASKNAAYTPFGVDVFLCQRKIDHIARYVELPAIDASKKLPSILVVNVQVPLYPASIFQSEIDGEGMSIVLYFKLSENYATNPPSNFQDNIRRLIEDEVERVRAFPMDTLVAFRERLKILGRVTNVDDLHLSTTERKLMHAYNEKPVLSRPQHEFYSGEGYFEIDLDMHRFSYISRKGCQVFLDRLKLCVLDVGLTIQGNKGEELPEQVLCCIRLNGLEYANYKQLRVSPDPSPHNHHHL